MAEKSKLRIGVGIDDVLTETFRELVREYNKRYNKGLKFENIGSYHLWEVWDLSKEESLKLGNEVCKRKDLVLLDNVKEILLKLFLENELLIVSSRPSEIRKETESFLLRNFGNIFSNFCLATGVHGEGDSSKKEICVNEDIEILAEDHAETSLECAKAGIKVLLLDKPWNQGVKHENIIRVYDWNEIYKKINELKKRIVGEEIQS